jgi:hypothetical protein
MARKLLTNIDLAGNQILSASFEKLTADPASGNFKGRMYFNTTDNILKVYDGTNWSPVGDITNVEGTTNEIDVSVSAAGVATVSLPATINADTTGNAATATKLATSRTIELTGDVTGSASFDGSANASITATIAANSVALGTDTTGDYVSSVSASDGISATGTGEGASVALTNTDKGSSQNIFKNVAVAGQSDIVADTNNDTITVASGTGISITTNATTDTLTIGNSGVTAVAGTSNQITASASTGSVTLSLPNAVTFPGTVTLNADPTTALGAATKQYVDTVAEGLNVHPAVSVATTANIADLDNPPASIDGVTLTDQMRVLIKNQSTTSENGIYVYDLATTALVRASDYNAASEIDPGDFFFVTAGSTYASTGFVQTATVVTLGTDPVAFIQFSGAGTYTAGNGLTLTGSSFSINTGVTADLTTAQTLTNKTLTSPTISGLYLSDNNIIIEGTSDTHETTLTFTDPTADRTITFKDASGTVAFTSDIPSNTDGLTEGSTNLYFTDERAQDAVGNMLVDGTTIDFTYSDSTPSITAEVILKSSNSYLSSTSGLNVDISAVESKLVTDGFTKKAVASVGNASNTSFAVSHGLSTRDVQVQIYDNATYDTVECDVVRTDTSTVTVSFSVAPSLNAYRVVIVG